MEKNWKKEEMEKEKEETRPKLRRSNQQKILERRDKRWRIEMFSVFIRWKSNKDTFITCNTINIILLAFYFKVYNDKPNSMLNEFKTFNAHYAITTIKVVYFIHDLTSGFVANYKTNFPFNALQEIQFPSQLKV